MENNEGGTSPEEKIEMETGAPTDKIDEDENVDSEDKGLNEGVEAANTENTSQSDGNNVLNDVTDHQTSDSTADVPAAASEADERGESVDVAEPVVVEAEPHDSIKDPEIADPVAFSAMMNGGDDSKNKTPTPVEEVENPSASPSIEMEIKSKDGDIDSNNSEPVSTTQLISPEHDYNPSRGYPAPMSANVPSAPSYGAGTYPSGQAGGAYPSAGGGGAYPYHQPGASPYQQAGAGGGPPGSSQGGYSTASTVAIMNMEDPVKPGPGGDAPGPSRAGATSSGAPSNIREKQDDEQYSELEASDVIMVGLAYIMLVLLFPVLILGAFKVLNSFERAVIFRLGKIKTRTRPPTGVVFLLPCTDEIHIVDTRTRSVNVPAQEILTKDSVTCRVDGILFYEIKDPIKSVTKVEDVSQSVALLTQTALRTVLGCRTLPEILAAKMAISHDIMEIVEERAQNWGVQILRVDLKDMILAPQLQRALVAEAETARSAKAQVIRADGEHKAAEMLTKASEILNDSSVGVQLRYLQTLSQISGTNNKTIVLPLPPILAEKAIGGLVNSLRK